MNSRDVLSPNEAYSLLDIFSEALKCSDIESLRKLIPKLQGVIEFDMAIGGYASVGSILKKDNLGSLRKGNVAAEILNAGYPEEYLEKYLSGCSQSDDLVLKQALRTGEVCNFKDVARQHGNENHVRKMAIEYGLQDGFAYGVLSPRKGYISTFFFAANKVENTLRTKYVIHQVVPFFAEALMRFSHSEVAKKQYALTPKELEVLKWVSEGKSSWDISVILEKSERVVNFHIANIIMKLDASNRTHAVAIASTYRILDC